MNPFIIGKVRQNGQGRHVTTNDQIDQWPSKSMDIITSVFSGDAKNLKRKPSVALRQHSHQLKI